MRVFRWFLPILILGFFFLLKNSVFSQGPIERKIVVFKPDVSQAEKQNVFSQYKAVFGKNLGLINGAAVDLPEFLAERLARDPRVLRVDPDVEVFALSREVSAEWNFFRRPTPTPTPTPTPEVNETAQSIPWGITKIHADDAWQFSSGSGVRVAVVDTGIDRDHPDLKNNLAGCKNFISSRKTCDDDNGHGTHVSGIIAAQNNNLGVVGVAPKAKIYSLKVLDSRGSGYLSDIIEALDWAVQNKMQVVNMSLGTSSDVISFHDAVKRVNTAGIVQVAAAGNSGPGTNTVIYPAKYPEVIAAAATDSSNNVPSWSSRGPEVDLAAPGASVYSTYLSGKYMTMSGTSMAAPHVTGVVALRLQNHPGTNPSAIESLLEANTDILSITDPNLVGAGLVDALKVVSAP